MTHQNTALTTTTGTSFVSFIYTGLALLGLLPKVKAHAINENNPKILFKQQKDFKETYGSLEDVNLEGICTDEEREICIDKKIFQPNYEMLEEYHSSEASHILHGNMPSIVNEKLIIKWTDAFINKKNYYYNYRFLESGAGYVFRMLILFKKEFEDISRFFNKNIIDRHYEIYDNNQKKAIFLGTQYTKANLLELAMMNILESHYLKKYDPDMRKQYNDRVNIFKFLIKQVSCVQDITDEVLIDISRIRKFFPNLPKDINLKDDIELILFTNGLSSEVKFEKYSEEAKIYSQVISTHCDALKKQRQQKAIEDRPIAGCTIL